MKTTLFIIVSLISALSVCASVKDSVGVEKKGDKYFIQHKMEAKETLYALSRKYNVSVDQIKSANPGVNINDISIGQIILIPSKYSGATTRQQASTSGNGGSNVHKVEPKETLYSLSRQYNVTVDELKKANPELAEKGLQIGMQLVIPRKEQNSVKQVAAVSKNEPAKSSAATSKPVATKPAEPVATTTKPKTGTVERKTAQAELPSKNNKIDKVNETGIAEVVSARQDAPDFFAYHKSAPVGTIILVVNNDNNQKAYVRVIGALKEGVADNVLIQLSPKAMERIKADAKVKVNLSYFLP